MTITEAYTLQDAREFWDYNMLGDKIYYDIEHLFQDNYKVTVSGADKREFSEKGTTEFRTLWKPKQGD